MQSDAPRVSWFGKAWRVLVMVPVFGAYLIIARWRLWRRRPIEVIPTIRVGAVMLCRPPDLVMMYAHVFGVWEPDITRFIERRLQRGDVFIDVGANVGYDSLVAASVVGHEGGVVSIEASPRIHAMLRDNIERNASLRNIRTVLFAAGSARGEVTVHRGPEQNLGRTTTSARSGYEPEATVQSLPLHEMLTDDEITRARLVKIDVEGGEDQVLAGMMTFLERCPASTELLVELTPRWWTGESTTPAQLLEPLFNEGFHAYELPNNYWPWRYLWPNDVLPPRRVRFDLNRPVRRLDLVLSRVNADEL